MHRGWSPRDDPARARLAATVSRPCASVRPRASDPTAQSRWTEDSAVSSTFATAPFTDSHQFSGSDSTQPGRGLDSRTGTEATASSTPLASRRIAFVEPVPRSIPSTQGSLFIACSSSKGDGLLAVASEQRGSRARVVRAGRRLKPIGACVGTIPVRVMGRLSSSLPFKFHDVIGVDSLSRRGALAANSRITVLVLRSALSQWTWLLLLLLLLLLLRFPQGTKRAAEQRSYAFTPPW